MASLNTSLPSRYSREYLPASLQIRFGKRVLHIGPDFRRRYYAVSPLIECSTGVQRGHVEVLLFRKWLLVFTKARG